MRNRRVATLSSVLIALSVVVALAGSHHTKLGGVRSLSLPAQAVLDENAQPLIAESGRVGFIASVTGGSVISFSVTSGKILSSISVGESAGPLSMVEANGRRLIAAPAVNRPADGSPAAVSIVDATRSKAMQTVSLLVLPPDALITPSTAALLSADGRFCFIASSFDEPTLFSFEVETGKLISRLALPGRPSEVSLAEENGHRTLAIASSAANSLLLAGVGSDGSLSLSGSFSPKASRFSDSNNPAFNSDGSTLFIAAAEGDRLYEIDANSGAEIASVRISSPQRVTVGRRAEGGDAIAVTRAGESAAGMGGGVSVFTSEDGQLKQLSSFEPPEEVKFSRSNNAVFAAGGTTVFVASTTGVLFAFNAEGGDLESYNVVGSALHRIALSEKARAVAAVRSTAAGDQVVVVGFDLAEDGEPDPSAPVIDSLVPSVVEQGRLKNLKLVVKGRNFSEGASLLVNGVEMGADLVRKGRALQTKLAKSLFDQVGAINVRVKGSNGSLSEEKELTVSRPGAPVIDHIEPSEVPGPSQPFTLLVKGSNFRPSSAIVVGDQPLNTERLSDKKLRARVPADIAGTVGARDVSVHDLAVPDLVSADDKQLLIFGPRISSLVASVDPPVAGDKRFLLRIRGENFRPGAQVTLSLNGQSFTPSQAQVHGRKLIRVRVSANAFQEAGTMSVVVQNSAGGSSDPAELAIRGPEIATFRPGRILAGVSDVQVDIRGANFRKKARVYVGNETGAFRIDRQHVRFRNSRRIVITLTGDLNKLLAAPGELSFNVVNPNASDGVRSPEGGLSVVGPSISDALESPAREEGFSEIVILGADFRRGVLVEFLVGDMVVRQQTPARFRSDKLSLLVRRKKLIGMGDYQVRVVNPGNVPSDTFHPRRDGTTSIGGDE